MGFFVDLFIVSSSLIFISKMISSFIADSFCVLSPHFLSLSNSSMLFFHILEHFVNIFLTHFLIPGCSFDFFFFEHFFKHAFIAHRNAILLSVCFCFFFKIII